MRAYNINTMDTETTPAWMEIAAKVTPKAQDSGRCRFEVEVTAENEKALITALTADDNVIDYVETITREQEQAMNSNEGKMDKKCGCTNNYLCQSHYGPDELSQKERIISVREKLTEMTRKQIAIINGKK